VKIQRHINQPVATLQTQGRYSIKHKQKHGKKVYANHRICQTSQVYELQFLP